LGRRIIKKQGLCGLLGQTSAASAVYSSIRLS
jgi:hypothetical protein